MTIQEMHTDVEVKLGTLAGSTAFAYLPGHIDWLLNNGLRSFIRKNIRPKPFWLEGLEDTQIQADKVSSLIKYKNIRLEHNLQEKQAFCRLPDDYFFLLNDYSKSTCNNDAVLTSDTFEYYAFIDLPVDPATTDIFKHLSLRITWSNTNVQTIFNLDDVIPYKNGLENKDSTENIIWAIRQYFPETRVLSPNIGNFALYWETYKGLKRPNGFIIVFTPDADNALPVPLIATWLLNGVVIPSSNFTFIGRLYNFYTLPQKKTFNERPNRLIRHFQLGQVLAHSLSKTMYESPVSTIRDKMLYVHYDNSFIPESVTVAYIKRPRVMSLYHNEHCDLEESVHELVVNEAVNLATATIPSDQYSVFKDNSNFDN